MSGVPWLLLSLACLAGGVWCWREDISFWLIEFARRRGVTL